MSKQKRTPPTPGHKCGGVYVSVGCECGWKSPAQRSRSGAYDEWRYHIKRHQQVAAGEIPCLCYGYGKGENYVHERGCPTKAEQDRQAYLAAHAPKKEAS